ncbi:MAG: hypothetical protein LBD22_03650, partial [Spirochaetaceae bacterium]|jgi:hypothetical protein|nr:hypothetical protein [Spirochaetaceae bacterium]
VSEVLPVTVDTSSTKALGQLNVTNAGIRISNPNELKTLEDNANKAKDFALSSDIDLEESGITWAGPSGYKGHFYGNGYTIKLALSKANGNTGLFTTVEGGAYIQDFTLDVSLADAAKTRNGSTYFGGVVGYIQTTASSSINLKNIKVKGNLPFTGTTASLNSPNYFLVGGLVGEIKIATGGVVIANCASELTATVGDYQWNASGTNHVCGFGGLIGRIGTTSNATLNVDISDCYAVGTISVKGASQHSRMFAGGLVGDIYATNGTTNVAITNCYSAGVVSAENTHTTAARSDYVLGAGGLVGSVWKNGGTAVNATIQNSAAVGEKAVAVMTNVTVGIFPNSRFAGVGTGGLAPTSTTFSDNIARKGMIVGVNTEAADDSEGAANDPDAAGTELTALQQASTWTTTLSWSTDTWDFSGLPNKWPTLKK